MAFGKSTRRLAVCVATTLALIAAPTDGAHALPLSSAAAPGAEGCAALKSLALKDVRITTAEMVTPDPKWPYPPSVFNALAGPQPGVSNTAFCRVAGVIETEINFELWLPQDWNGRFLGVGNGGLTGAINYPSMGESLAKGFAVASTDTGHKTGPGFFDASWVAGHWQRVVDFGHRAHHLMPAASKQILAAYYGRPATHSYYNGCSSGGWQGFTEAQKYPGDYDGIVAGAPAFNFVKLQTRELWLSQLEAKDPWGALSPAKAKLLVDAALARCDAEDGVTDGVMDPSQCDFDPARLQCRGQESDQCLTTEQIDRARLLYGPLKSPGGMSLYPGVAYGAPPSFTMTGPDATAISKPMILEVARDPKWTPKTFDPDRDTPTLEADVGPILSSYDPNLRVFKERGGKIVMYHGWADPLLSPYNSIAYLRAVQGATGSTNGFLRLFMVPGMGHCTGGPGTDRFDGLTAVMDWVEKGKAPDHIPASHMTKGAADRTRPLCPFPQVAKYRGQGSTDDSANFRCAAPQGRG
jgi:feruloyl esterase